MDIKKVLVIAKKALKVLRIMFYIIIVLLAMWGLFNFIINTVFNKIC